MKNTGLFLCAFFLLAIASCRTANHVGDSSLREETSDPAVAPQFVTIPAGQFIMGSMRGEVGRVGFEEEWHEVAITKSFLMQTTEVTQAQWVKVMGENPSEYVTRQDCREDFDPEKGPICPNNPVDGVEWDMALDFIAKLNAIENPGVECPDQRSDEGLKRALEVPGCYRLPTESEWEYAARGGLRDERFSLTGAVETFAWYKKNSEKHTHPVAKLLPNEFGLYDVNGNVSEWVADWYWEDYPTEAVTDPIGPLESGRVLVTKRISRGGGFHNEASEIRNASRGDRHTSSLWKAQGLRLVRNLPSQ